MPINHEGMRKKQTKEGAKMAAKRDYYEVLGV